MKIYLGSDHAGLEIKKYLKHHLEDAGAEVFDKGANSLDETDDYNDFIAPVAKAVSNDPESFGVILGASGQGEAMLANRFPNVRAAVFYGGSHEIIELSRKHNDANILSLGARFISADEALTVVKKWLSTNFLREEKYKRRIDKTEEITKRD